MRCQFAARLESGPPSVAGSLASFGEVLYFPTFIALVSIF